MQGSGKVSPFSTLWPLFLAATGPHWISKVYKLSQNARQSIEAKELCSIFWPDTLQPQTFHFAQILVQLFLTLETILLEFYKLDTTLQLRRYFHMNDFIHMKRLLTLSQWNVSQHYTLYSWKIILSVLVFTKCIHTYLQITQFLRCTFLWIHNTVFSFTYFWTPLLVLHVTVTLPTFKPLVGVRTCETCQNILPISQERFNPAHSSFSPFQLNPQRESCQVEIHVKSTYILSFSPPYCEQETTNTYRYGGPLKIQRSNWTDSEYPKADECIPCKLCVKTFQEHCMFACNLKFSKDMGLLSLSLFPAQAQVPES